MTNHYIMLLFCKTGVVMKFVKRHLEKNDRLLKHSMIVMAGTVMVNIINYGYQLMMGRLLGPADFGVLGALFSLITLITFSFNSIRTMMTKFASEWKNDLGKLRG